MSRYFSKNKDLRTGIIARAWSLLAGIPRVKKPKNGQSIHKETRRGCEGIRKD
jgi:hypothetical protein